MEFGPRFELSDNEFMQMKRILISSLWCLMIAACASQQVTISNTITPHFTGIPTSATIMPTITFVPVVYPNKFSSVGNGRIKFDNWHVSFLLPEKWDANKYFLGFVANPYTELYFFYGLQYSNDHGGKSTPELSFDFQHLPDNTDIDAFLKKIKNWTDDDQFKIEKYYSPKELGINLAQSIGYKCSYTYGYKKECYVLRIVYEREIVEVQLGADINTVQPFETQFLEITKSISVEQ
jgi:hypothetical protein